MTRTAVTYQINDRFSYHHCVKESDLIRNTLEGLQAILKDGNIKDNDPDFEPQIQDVIDYLDSQLFWRTEEISRWHEEAPELAY